MGRKQVLWGWIGAAALAVLILDSKTAIVHGAEAVQACITVLIPSLFPFFVFTPMVTKLGGSALKPVCSVLRIPKEAGGILLSGLLGGYPTGAQAISEAVKCGSLHPDDGKRMMAFCSNAGPAFLFGVGSQLFASSYCWLIWIIHILSAVAVSLITPGMQSNGATTEKKAISFPGALKNAVITTGLVCGWVVLFRVILGFCQRWFLWLLPFSLQVLAGGTMELANGCLQLFSIPLLGQRITYFSLFLALGGVCVWMQTLSVAQNVDTKLYLPGKLVQCSVSLLLCGIAQLLLVQEERYWFPGWVYGIGAGICVLYWFFMVKKKNKSRNRTAIGV